MIVPLFEFIDCRYTNFSIHHFLPVARKVEREVVLKNEIIKMCSEDKCFNAYKFASSIKTQVVGNGFLF